MLILGSILGVSVSLGPQGCSSWSMMVAGHGYTVPHYATALPGSIVGFKIPTLANIWPEMPLNCSFWVVFWWFLPPRSPRGVQVGPRWWQATGILSHTIPQLSQLALWVLNSQNRKKSGQKWPKNRHLGVYLGGLTLPGSTMRIQIGVSWSQATGMTVSMEAIFRLNGKSDKLTW